MSYTPSAGFIDLATMYPTLEPNYNWRTDNYAQPSQHARYQPRYNTAYRNNLNSNVPYPKYNAPYSISYNVAKTNAASKFNNSLGYMQPNISDSLLHNNTEDELLNYNYRPLKYYNRMTKIQTY
jgi:hypothetical protein